MSVLTYDDDNNNNNNNDDNKNNNKSNNNDNEIETTRSVTINIQFNNNGFPDLKLNQSNT